jgi:uncharacterized OB-fold protein
MSEYKKPLPVIQEWSRPFWKGAKEHKYLIQHCKDCGKNIFYPRKYCPDCWSSNLEWIESGGKGKIYTYTVTLAGAEEKFAADYPYVLALVDMEEGIRVMTNIVDCKPEEVKIGMDVEVVFRDVTDEISMPMFRPVKK